MDNFDLKKYLKNNLLLKEETLDEINVLDIIKKNIKKKYGVDASDDQIRFGDGTSISEVSEESITELNELLNLSKKTVNIDSISENFQCSLDEGRVVNFPGSFAAKPLCNLGVWVIATIFKSFPVTFARLSSAKSRKFIQQIFDGNSPQIYIDALDVEVINKGRNPIFKLILFPSKLAFSLFNTMVAVAVRIFQVVSATACNALLTIPDSFMNFTIKAIIRGYGEKVDYKDASTFVKHVNNMMKEFRNI